MNLINNPFECIHHSPEYKFNWLFRPIKQIKFIGTSLFQSSAWPDQVVCLKATGEAVEEQRTKARRTSVIYRQLIWGWLGCLVECPVGWLVASSLGLIGRRRLLEIRKKSQMNHCSQMAHTRRNAHHPPFSTELLSTRAHHPSIQPVAPPGWKT